MQKRSRTRAVEHDAAPSVAAMAAAYDGTGSASAMAARLQLAKLLRSAREATDITQEQAAHYIAKSPGTLYKIEAGHPGAKINPQVEIRLLCELYGITDPGTLDKLNALALATKVKGPFHPYQDVIPAGFDVFVDLERDAEALTSYDNELMPGLFQTETYATVVNNLPGGDGKTRSEAEIAKRVRLRLERQAVLTRQPTPLIMDVLLDEAVLQHRVGSASVMIEQLRRVSELSELPNVTVRVVPFGAGLHLGSTTGQFQILRLPEGWPPFAYSDGYLGGNSWKEPDEIARYEDAWANISEHALNADDSRAFIDTTAKELAQNE